jgi:hypothetical protein
MGDIWLHRFFKILLINLLEKKILFHHHLTAEDLYHHPDGGEDVECDVLGHVHRHVEEGGVSGTHL